MKKKKFKWLKVLGLVVVILLVIELIFRIIINNLSDNIGNISETEMSHYINDYTVREQNLTAYVKGTGEITSFNIQVLDIPSYSTIKEVYVNDGDNVVAKQKLIRAVIDGYSQIINSSIDGMYFETEVNGLNVYQIYDLKNIGIEMFVSENEAAKLMVGQKAYVRITALNKEVEGSISYISKLPQDGKFKVKVKIEYSDEIKFGYGASIRIVTNEKQNVLVIPYDALYMEDDKYYVIKNEFKSDLYKNYTSKIAIPETAKTYVEVGIITNSQVEIISGLKSGDVVEEWNW